MDILNVNDIYIFDNTSGLSFNFNDANIKNLSGNNCSNINSVITNLYLKALLPKYYPII